jgi:hypothetical protein
MTPSPGGSRPRDIRVVATVALACLLVTGLDPMVAQAAEPPIALPLPLTLTGTITGVIRYVDDCDLDGLSDLQADHPVDRPAQLMLSSVASDGTATEANPFGLLIGPAADDGFGQMGEVWLTSATVVVTPETARQLMIQYWSITYDTSSGVLAARLTDDHALEGAAAGNFFWDEQELIPCQTGLPTLMPFPLAEGATLSGTLGPTGAELDVDGWSSDQTRELLVHLSLSTAP